MKVNLSKSYKEFFTISDLERAKEVIKWMKDDESSVKDYAEIVVNHVLVKEDNFDSLYKIIDAVAEVRTNGRVFDAYCSGSGRMDVWLEVVARTTKGYLEVGAYLTDIWNIGADTDMREHMWIQHYYKQD